MKDWKTIGDSLLKTVAVAGLALVAIVNTWRAQPAPTPTPTPTPQPVVTIDPARSYVTRNGVTLDDAEATKVVAVVGLGDGAYSLVSYPVGAKPITKTLIIGEVQPIPPGPTPPGPQPPKPPEPEPIVDPSPIPNLGFRAMFYIESKDLTKLPKSQQAILGDPAIQAYLNSKCVKGIDNKTPEWRIFDDQDNLANEAEIWRRVRSLVDGKSQPWLLVANGKTGYSGPLPQTAAETLAILKKHGGE